MSANEDLLDASIRHQIDLQKYSNSVVKRLIAVLNRSDDQIFKELVAAIERLDPSSFTIQRLESLLGSVRSINSQAYAQVGNELKTELKNFVEFEAQYQTMTLGSVFPASFNVGSVNVDQVYAAALARPFQGVILKGALSDLEDAKAKRIRQAIAQGFVEGKTNSQIVRDIRGTRALKYADGLLEIDRRNLQTIVQTAVAHTAAFTKNSVYDENKDIIKSLMWSAKIDLKTSSPCRIRDGKTWTTDKKPIGHSLPWGGGPGAYHWNCRSVAVPVLKSFTELLGIGIDESQFSKSTWASLDGQVPADIDYNDWLKKQSAARQDEVLGVTRGKLLREGKLTIEQMYSNKGEFLDLQELRKKYGI